MKLDAGEIRDLVQETERKRQQWADAADVWEGDWRLARYDDTREHKREMDGIDIVVSPDPFNVIQLAHRFIADEPRVEVPSLSPKEDDEERSEKMEEFAVAFEQANNREQGKNLIHAKVWQSGVLGRGASQVLWVEPILKEMKLSGRRLPISKRSLDPRNVGVGRGSMGVDYAYHKYKCSRSYIEQNYPKFKLPEPQDNIIKQGYYHENYTVIDFWARHKGAIWHSVVIGGANAGINEFAISPVQTDYPDVPIIEWFSDGAPVDDELSKSVGLLHPIHELWKMKCDLMSKVATGLMYHYDPAVIFKGFNADQDIQFGPGANIFIKADQSVEAFRPEPNVPMAQAMLAMIQTGIDQATFATSTYGDAPGGVTAGFAIANLNQSSRARVNVIRSNIESAMEQENQLLFGMIEALAPDEGIEIYGRSARGDRGKPIRLTKKDIKSNYENRVILLPENPADDTQRLLAYSTLLDKGVISRSFMQNRVMNIPVPRDEELRIAVDRALTMPEVQQKATLRALQKTRKEDDWQLLIVGTPLQQLWEQEKQWLEQKRQEEEQAKAQRAQEREQKRLQELLEQGKAHMMPDGSIMEGPPMMPPSMSGSPMEPSISGPMMGAGGLPPIPPPGMPSGMPPDMGSIQPQGLPNVPPQMAGQLTPDQLGLPPGAPPGMFDQLMGGPPPSEEDLLNGMMGGQPPMM